MYLVMVTSDACVNVVQAWGLVEYLVIEIFKHHVQA